MIDIITSAAQNPTLAAATVAIASYLLLKSLVLAGLLGGATWLTFGGASAIGALTTGLAEFVGGLI